MHYTCVVLSHGGWHSEPVYVPRRCPVLPSFMTDRVLIHDEIGVEAMPSSARKVIEFLEPHCKLGGCRVSFMGQLDTEGFQLYQVTREVGDKVFARPVLITAGADFNRTVELIREHIAAVVEEASRD